MLLNFIVIQLLRSENLNSNDSSSKRDSVIPSKGKEIHIFNLIRMGFGNASYYDKMLFLARAGGRAENIWLLLTLMLEAVK